MKVTALIIGISNYDNKEQNLKNPVNDANDLNDKFQKLGYDTKCYVDVTNQEFDEIVYNFGFDLNKNDIGIFYFAGHGLQIKGENFLTAKNTNFKSERDAKFSSMPLNKILDAMDSTSNNTNIIILDACRDNPYEKKWDRSIANNSGLAPVHAPKGTLIAYATSPGQVAKDGIGDNGLYTSAFLQNLEVINLSIEDFFKRVRNSVYTFSNGEQTTWEHTSLTGTFSFNNGIQFNNSIDKKYADYAIKDSEFKYTGTELSKIIIELKSSNWYKQSPAIEEFKDLKFKESYDKNELFILGRNFLQTANGGEDVANQMIENISSWIENFNSPDNENHFLDGLLFEIYFDSKGIYRDQDLKDRLIDNLSPLQNNEKLEKSFNFIEEQLLPFSNRQFYHLKFKNEPIQLNIVFDKTTEESDSIYTLKNVTFEDKQVLKIEKSGWFKETDPIKYQPILRAYLEPKISQLTKIPKEYLKIISNYDNEINQSSKINIPIGYKINRQ